MGEKRKRSDDSYSEVELVVKGVSETSEKRQRVEVAEPCTPQLLTRENLALLEGKMPPKSNTEGGTSNSKTPNTKSSATDHGKQVQILHFNGMEMERTEAMKSKLGKEIIGVAQELVTFTRDSVMSEKTVNHFIEQRTDRQFSNEDTFVDVMWRILLPESRSVKKPPTDELKEQQEWLIKRWDESSLRHNRNQQFRKGSVPPAKDKKAEKELDLTLRKLPDVSNPKPDLAYGLSTKAFGHHEGLVNLKLEGISDISQDILYPFFVIEFKSGKGDFQAATIQACRGGAALVYSMRQLRETAGLKNYNQEDNEGRMAFSMAMSASMADIYVHWAHKKKSGKVIYEMARLDGFDLQKEGQIPKLRSHIDNILDWGVLKRKFYIKKVLAKVDPNCGESTSSEEEDEDEEEEEEDDDDDDDDDEEEDEEDGDGEEDDGPENSEDELSRK